jgi:putative endonuclease
MNRHRAERGGRRAETLAAWWLRLKGYAILARRVRTPRGEVDLVARRGHTLVFVEVKARATTTDASLALDDYRLRRVAAAAEALAPRFSRPNDDVRIDAVVIVPGRLPRHIVHVWRG